MGDRTRGIDSRGVTASRMRQSTSASHAFAIDTIDPVRVRAALLDQAVTLAERIRGRDQIAHKVPLAVRLAGGSTAERTRTLPTPSAHTEDLRSTV